MSKLKNLEDFLIDELKDLYSAEKQLTKAIPKMIKATTSPELKKAFEDHLKETNEHVSRLEKISEMIGRGLGGKKCSAMEGLIEEGEDVIKEEMTDEVRDVALIAAAQRVEHYEIAAYGCARTYARLCGYEDIMEYLQETLDEEGNANEKLNEIAEELNPVALTE
ncbi:MAG TPA: ferritin-like domain-containing protein [Bacteroidetes bacterium]|nr:ferritin-like domain-containing protein [Ignavibacteria bacterium]HCA43632.1 ferritin-like domain-containing protein [Bacteroidota bacterium]